MLLIMIGIGPYINDNNVKFSIRGGGNGFNNLTNFTVHGNGNWNWNVDRNFGKENL